MSMMKNYDFGTCKNKWKQKQLKEPHPWPRTPQSPPASRASRGPYRHLRHRSTTTCHLCSNSSLSAMRTYSAAKAAATTILRKTTSSAAKISRSTAVDFDTPVRDPTAVVLSTALLWSELLWSTACRRWSPWRKPSLFLSFGNLSLSCADLFNLLSSNLHYKWYHDPTASFSVVKVFPSICSSFPFFLTDVARGTR